MKSFNYIVLFAFFLIFFSQPALSQDHHYWGQQFGSRSALMGGAVVGGVRDTSAGFYNPAALGFVNKPSLSVSASAYQMEQLSVDNGAGTGESLDSDKMSVIPLLTSGTMFFDPGSKHRFGYSLLAKNQTTTDMSGREEKNQDVIGDIHHRDGTVSFQGDERFIGQLITGSDVTELWGGMSWAYQIRQNISVGATSFLAMRNQSQSKAISARAQNADIIATADRLDYVDFWNIRGLLKLGVAAEFAPLKLGLTVTSPSLNFFGQGTVAGEDSTNNVYDSEQDRFVGRLISDRQENLDTTYNTPLSVALGLEYAVTPKTNLAATLEWFAEQDQYDIFTPGSHSFLRDIVVDELIQFDEDAEERQALIQYNDAAESVVNFALAVEHSFSDKMNGYLSFRTDHETNSHLDGHSLGISNWDIFHLTGGATFRRERSELAIGLTYSFGKRQDNFKQLANFDEIGADNLLGDSRITAADYNAFSLIVGYTYFFDRK